MKRIDYTFMLTLGASIGACPVLAQQNVSKPNIVLILLDDVGYSDFGCYGSEINTPNIDRLAENGIRLRHFYNQARSAPTRASLITGLYSSSSWEWCFRESSGLSGISGISK